MKTTDTVLMSIGAAAAFVFVALIVPLHPYAGSFVLKALPCILLAIVVLRNVKSRPGFLFAAGLLLSGVGDVALDLDRQRFFIVGLSAFLVAHLLYASVFLHWRGWARRLAPGVFLVLLYASVLGYLLGEIPVDKLVPVLAYLSTITTMVICAICVRPFSGFIVVGAIIFMASDTVIAVNKFMHPIPHSTVFNIGLYFAAQFLLTKGILSRAALYSEKSANTLE